MPSTRERDERAVGIPADAVSLESTMVVLAAAQGIVLFAHGSGSSRQSPRNRAVAMALVTRLARNWFLRYLGGPAA